MSDPPKRHDRDCTSQEGGKLTEMPCTDPRCHGLPQGKVMFACNMCDFCPIVGDNRDSRKQAVKQAKEAHMPKGNDSAQFVPSRIDQAANSLPMTARSQDSIVPMDTMDTDGAATYNEAGCLSAPLPQNALQYSSQFAPMQAPLSSSTMNRRSDNSVTSDNGVVRKQITRSIMPDGTIVENEVSEEHKNTHTETQKVELEMTITHLQSQLQLVDKECAGAKGQCHILQRNNAALGDRFSNVISEAVMNKAPGTELTIALILIPRLALALEMLKEDGRYEAFCKNLPLTNLHDPLIANALKERGGVGAFTKLLAMTDADYEQELPNLSKVGATPDLLRELRILPTIHEQKPPSQLTLSKGGPIYFPETSFKIDYPEGELPSLYPLAFCKVGNVTHNIWECEDSLTNMIHLHLTRADGERPTLKCILGHGRAIQRVLPQNEHRYTTCYIASNCSWENPMKPRKNYTCWVAEDLIRKHYPEKVEQYNQLYGTRLI